MLIKKQYNKARTGLDNYLLKPKNAAKAEPWYLKGFVYNTLAQSAAKPVAEIDSLNREAFFALKKYGEMDTEARLTEKEENTSLYNVYNSFYGLGIRNYNNKNYEAAYNSFVKALEVHDYIYANRLAGPKGWRFSAHDTGLIWKLVVLGNDLKRTGDVLTYYRKITDADLADEKYVEAYETILRSYKEEKNKMLFEKYLARAKKYYPTEPYWEAIDIEYALAGLEKEALFKKYDELGISYPNSYMLFFNYGYELSKYVNAGDAGLEIYKQKIPAVIKKALSIKSTADANMLLANFYYNNSIDIANEAIKIKSTKPEDIKKKNELIALRKTILNQAIPYAEEAVRLFVAI